PKNTKKANPVYTRYLTVPIITNLSGKLYQNDYVSINFTSEVIYREELSSTSFSNMAVPHSMQLDAEMTTIAVAILKNKTQWGDNNVNVVLLLAISNENRNEFKRLFQTVLQIFTSEEWNQTYRNISNFEQFIDFVIRYSNK
ncbi:MAG: PRD/PTS system IIA 2 domain protein, partial [Erysipelotrichaceae bacterium]